MCAYWVKVSHSGRSQWGWGLHAVRGGVDPRDDRYCCSVVGATEVDRGWSTTSPLCDGIDPHVLVGLYPHELGGAVELEPFGD